MSITEEISFDKEGKPIRYPWFNRFFLALIILLVALLSFGIGRLTATVGRAGVSIEYDPQLTTNNQQIITNTNQGASVINALNNQKTDGEVVASKNSNKYHYTYCPGAKQINEENKIYFDSAQSAEASGYTLAGNCTPP